MGRETRRRMRLLVLVGLVGLAVLLGLASAPAPANAQMKSNEFYLAGFVGGAFLNRTDLDITHDTGPPSGGGGGGSLIEIKARGVTFDSSPVVGAKGGFCPGALPNLCVELEFDHLNPKIENQVVKGDVTDDGVPIFSQAGVHALDLSVWNLGLNLIGRVAFLPESGYPLGGRMHLYGGAGPSFVWTHAKEIGCESSALVVGISATIANDCGKSDTDFSVGVQALGGVKFFITKNLAVFGEYKFKHWTSDFRFSHSGPAGGVVGAAAATLDTRIENVTFNTHLFYVGLAYHF